MPAQSPTPLCVRVWGQNHAPSLGLISTDLGDCGGGGGGGDGDGDGGGCTSQTSAALEKPAVIWPHQAAHSNSPVVPELLNNQKQNPGLFKEIRCSGLRLRCLIASHSRADRILYNSDLVCVIDTSVVVTGLMGNQWNL